MEIRITPEDQTALRQLGCEQPLADLLRIYRNESSYPWREVWVAAVAGLVLFHFRRWDDLRGQYHRVPLGVLHLRGLSDDTLSTVAQKLLDRAGGIRPAAPLAQLSPLVPALRHPDYLVHHDTAVSG